MLPVALFAALAALLAGQAKPCIVYRHNGELRASCSGKNVLLLRKRGLASFAIGAGGGTVLGGIGWAYLLRSGKWAKLRVSPATWTADIYASCGIAFAPHGNFPQPKQVTLDVVSGKEAKFTNLQWPQCSADRALIVGIDSVGRLVTNSGRVLDGNHISLDAYSVSPSGRWIAVFDQDALRLCITDTRNWDTRCFSTASSTPTLSVNDAGEVLLEEGTTETCWGANEGTIVSRKKFPGAGADQCFGVGIASPTAAPRVIIPLGSRPAWVSKKNLQAQFRVFK